MKNTIETPKWTGGRKDKGIEGALWAVKNPGFQAGFLGPDLRIIDDSTTGDVGYHLVQSPTLQIRK